MGNPLLPGGSPAQGGGSANPLLQRSSSGTKPKPKTKASLKKQKKNALQRLASIPGEAAKDVAGVGKSALVLGLEALDRPGQAIKGALAEGGGPAAFYRPADALRGAYRGLTGKDHRSFQETVSESTGGVVNLPTKGGLGFGISLAGDVATDPLTYASLGTSTAAKVGLKGVEKGLGSEAAQAIVKKGVAKSGVPRESIEAALRASLEEGGGKLAKGGVEGAVARQLKALDKGARGGIKLGGRTVVGGSKLGTAGRAVTEARPAAATMTLIGRSPAGKAGRALRTAFIPHAGVKAQVGKAAGTQFGEGARLFDAQASNATEDAVVRMAAPGRKVDEAGRAAVTDALHDPALVPTLSAPARKLFDAVDAVRQAMTTWQLRAGVLLGIRNTDRYFSRAATPEGEKIISEALGTSRGGALASRLFKAPSAESLGIDMKQGFRHARRFMPDAHVREVNEALVKRFQEAGFDVKDGTKFFHEDPIAAFGNRAQAANRAIARNDFVDYLGTVATNEGAPLVARAGRHTPAAEAELRSALADARRELVATRLKAAKAAGAAKEAERGANFARGRQRLAYRRGEDTVGEATVNLATATKAAKDATAAAKADLVKTQAAVKAATVRQAKAAGALAESRKSGGDVLRRLGHTQGAIGAIGAPRPAEAPLVDIKALEREVAGASKALSAAKAAQAKSEGALVEARRAAARAAERETKTAARKVSDETLAAMRTRIKDMEEQLRPRTDAEVLAAIPEDVRGAYVATTFNGEKVAVHQSVKKDLEAMESLLSSDEAMRGLAQQMNRVNALWKGMATVLPVSGGFFSRNAETNIFAAWLKGLKDPRRYSHAMRIQRAAAGGRKAGEIGGALAGEDRELWDLARKWGVLEGGLQVQDVGNVVLDANLGKAGTITQKAKNLGPIRAGRKLNSAIENNARLALFIDGMKKHGDPEQAARTVKEALFDYGDLTPVERKVFRNVMGFYTFARKNVALQAKTLASQPGKLSAIEHFRQALIGAAEGELPEGTEVPAYLQKAGGFLLPRGVTNIVAPGSEGPTFLQPDLGPTSALQTLDPFIQAARALVPGGESIDTMELARGFLNVPSGAVPAGVQALTERATGKDSFTGVPSSDPLQKLLAEGLIPGIRKLDKAKRDVASGNVASFIGGIKATEVDERKEKAELYRQLEKIQRRMTELKRAGKTVPTLKDLGLTGSGGGKNPLLP